jgi:predicted ATPase
VVEQGRVDEGIEQLRESLARVAATGANINGPYVLSKLVEAYRIAGRAEPGLRTVDEALSKSQRAHDRYWEAELYRQKGELLLLAGRDVAAAEQCFQEALEVARAQHAKSLELRAAMSLSRLWRQRDAARRAYQFLDPIYSWFTEGFDTRDLQDAKLLLDQLRAECH